MVEQLQKYNIKLLLVIFGIANCGAYHFLSASALGGMKVDPAFAGTSDTMLQQIPSIPSLLVVPGALALPIMARYISKKKLAMLGALLMFLTGILPAFSTNMTLILIGRAIGGFCMGFMLPIGTTLIYEEFFGDARKNVTAWNNMAAALITGVLIQALNGVLANINWRYVYYSYTVFLIVFILVLLLMPDKGVERAEKTGGPTIVISGIIILFGIMTALNQLLVRTLVNNLSMLVAVEGTKNQAIVGTSMSMMTLGSSSMGLIFVFISKKLKGATRSLGTLLIGVGLFVIFQGYDSNIMPIIGALILGGGTMLNMSANMLSLAAAVPATALTGAMVTYNIFYNVGQYVAPLVTNNLSLIVGETIRDRFLFSAILALALAVIYYILRGVDRKTYEEEPVQESV
ncbi:MFS transporter [Neomoorella mulderi]|uniref:Major facilitator superfamily protein n=1 Tax=Moorella mulderi DSM 14980 TaxID=1122241 RepID=A0A151AV06_9FIRM|nr:MFS transporter [Moorella mulderi]KYH31486.1 major facilitator superfamily protein [Moorella mulderi DSM 14980]